MMTDQRPYRGLTKEGKWVYGDLITLHYPKMLCIAEEGTTQHWSNTRFIEVIPETVSQSTGLKNKKRTAEFPDG